MLRNIALLTLLIIALGAPVGKAMAQDRLPSDPAPDAPAGVVYELPLDTARVDAAPRAGGGDRDGGIRSENNFSSSSEVPGVATGGGGGSPPAATGAPNAAAVSKRPASEGAAEPRAAKSVVAAKTAAAAGAGDGPSLPLALALLAAIALVGTGVGVAAGRDGRPRSS